MDGEKDEGRKSRDEANRSAHPGQVWSKLEDRERRRMFDSPCPPVWIDAPMSQVLHNHGSTFDQLHHHWNENRDDDSHSKWRNVSRQNDETSSFVTRSNRSDEETYFLARFRSSSVSTIP